MEAQLSAAVSSPSGSLWLRFCFSGLTLHFWKDASIMVQWRWGRKIPKDAKFLYLFWQPAVSKKTQISPGSWALREATHIVGDTAHIPVHLSECPSCSYQCYTAWSMNLSTGNWFLNVKFNTLNSTRQTRETESRFNIAFGYHRSNRPPSFTQRPAGQHKWRTKFYSPDEFFRATLSTGAFKMTDDYIWLVFKESHH